MHGILLLAGPRLWQAGAGDRPQPHPRRVRAGQRSGEHRRRRGHRRPGRGLRAPCARWRGGPMTGIGRSRRSGRQTDHRCRQRRHRTFAGRGGRAGDPGRGRDHGRRRAARHRLGGGDRHGPGPLARSTGAEPPVGTWLGSGLDILRRTAGKGCELPVEKRLRRVHHLPHGRTEVGRRAPCIAPCPGRSLHVPAEDRRVVVVGQHVPHPRVRPGLGRTDHRSGDAAHPSRRRRQGVGVSRSGRRGARSRSRSCTA